jgi:hypothetical protein
MQKDLGAVIACDKAEAFFVIKKFYFAGRHASYFQLVGV